jgi:hypothetical protein|tara:strand:+ start:1066 stop:1377 length:312 start_codon:yes stop_codon:yes gene_type:complete
VVNSVGTFQPNTLQWSVQTVQTVDNTAANTKHYTCTGFRVVHIHANQEFLINFGTAEANCGANDLEVEAGSYSLAIPDAIGDDVIMNLLAASSDDVTLRVVLS